MYKNNVMKKSNKDLKEEIRLLLNKLAELLVEKTEVPDLSDEKYNSLSEIYNKLDKIRDDFSKL